MSRGLVKRPELEREVVRMTQKGRVESVTEISRDRGLGSLHTPTRSLYEQDDLTCFSGLADLDSCGCQSPALPHPASPNFPVSGKVPLDLETSVRLGRGKGWMSGWGWGPLGDSEGTLHFLPGNLWAKEAGPRPEE